MAVTILQGDVRDRLRELPDESVHCCVTSPPYWGLRDYGTGRWEGGDPACDHRSPTMREGRNEDRTKLAGSHATNSYQNVLAHNAACGKCGAIKVDDQIGLERTLAEHIGSVVEVFREVRRVLRKDGTVWLNYGDAYATAPNGRSAAGTKALGNDDRTFRDKPMSTIGPIIGQREGDDVRGAGGKEGYRPGHSNRIFAGGVLKAKDRMLLPARVAIALQDDGWWIRDEIIWHKPNPMPSSVKDRTTPAHEMIYMLTKAERYAYDNKAIREPVASSSIARLAQNLGSQKGSDRANGGVRADKPMKAVGESDMRQKRSVWTVSPKGFKEAHFATFPPDLIRPCILAGCPEGGTVLDPFFGAGTTGLVATEHGRNCIGIELNPNYVLIAKARLGLLGPAEELLG